MNGKLTEEGMKLLASVEPAFKTVHEYISQSIPNGREKSLAITNLQQAAMWTSQAIALNNMQQGEA